MDHNELIKEQFNKQAAAFGNIPGHYDALDMLLKMTDAGPEDHVLDVACGPGIVAGAFAPKVKFVTGIDLAPAMIERAKAMQKEKGFCNMTWDLGDVNPLPYPDCSFSIAVTRFSFHHFTHPLAVLKQMDRVTQWGGRVCVADVFMMTESQAKLYNAMEKLRDPSHVQALRLDELKDMFAEAGLVNVDIRFYQLEVDVEDLLAATFTPTKEAEQFSRIVKEDIGINAMGIQAYFKNNRMGFFFPIAVMLGEKKANEQYGISCCGQ